MQLLKRKFLALVTLASLQTALPVTDASAECTRQTEEEMLRHNYDAIHMASAQYNQAQLALLTFPAIIASSIAIPATIMTISQVAGFLIGAYKVGFEGHQVRRFLDTHGYDKAKDELYFDFLTFHCFETIYNPISRVHVHVPGPNIFVPYVGIIKNQER